MNRTSIALLSVLLASAARPQATPRPGADPLDTDVFLRAVPDPPPPRKSYTRSEIYAHLARMPMHTLAPWGPEIDRRLAAWAPRQNDDGSFGDGDQNRLRITSLTILAFSGRGYTLDDPDHGPLLRRAVSWLLAHQQEDGRIVVSDTEPDARTFAQATFALIDVSYSPDYPKFEYPRLMRHARRALDHLDAFTDPDHADIWVIATRAYGVCAGLREPRTSGAPAPGTRLTWQEAVVQTLTIDLPDAPDRGAFPAEDLGSRALGSDLDEAYFAWVVGVRTLYRSDIDDAVTDWIHGRPTYLDWEPADREPIELDETTLLRTLILTAHGFKRVQKPHL